MDYRDCMIVGVPKPEELPNGWEEAKQTVPEMRRRIHAARHYSHLIRQCMQRAEMDGLNGEDTMTVLAYFALRQFEDLYQRQSNTGG